MARNQLFRGLKTLPYSDLQLTDRDRQPVLLDDSELKIVLALLYGFGPDEPHILRTDAAGSLLISTPAGAAHRLDYYDRNPTHPSIGYQASAVAPHAQTTRATYTVPAGRLARIEVCNLEGYQDTAGTGIGNNHGVLFWQPVEGGNVNVFEAGKLDDTLNARFGFVNAISQLGTARAGDKLLLVTADHNTGGSVTYDLNLLLTEFDA